MSSAQDADRFDHFDDLLRAARDGDRDAQGLLLETCRRPLLRLARRELNRTLQAKGNPSDMVQDTFLTALREIDGFRGCTPDQLLGWLRLILSHRLSNFCRDFYTEKRRVTREAPGQAAPAGEDARRAAASPSDVAIRRELAERVRRALHRLPRDSFEVVRLRHEANLSFKEIGQLTGRTASAARKVWVRAIEEVRDGL